MQSNLESPVGAEQKVKKRGRPRKLVQESKMVLRVDLEEELQKDFNKIKNEQGFTNNTEVLRFCIKNLSSGKLLYHISSDVLDIIEGLAQDPRIREKYFVTTPKDVIDRAIQAFIQKAAVDRSNLFDVTYRMKLDISELEVANALIEIQGQNPSWGATLIDLKNTLPEMDQTVVEAILVGFIQRDLAKTISYKGNTYFFALDRGNVAREPIK